MPDHTHPNDPAKQGLFSNLSELAAAGINYLKARATLAGMESREAGVHFGIAAALAIGALILLVFGYVFIVVTLVFVIALAFGGGNAWIGVLAAAALLHLILAIILALLAKNRLRHRMFAMTLEELQKDSQWLNHLAKKH